MVLTRRIALVPAGAAMLLAGAYACSSFDESAAPGADATTEASLSDASAESVDADASATRSDASSFCDGHTLCWTFDEPNLAAPAGGELRFEKSGIDGTNALVAETSTVSGESRVYAQVPHAGPKKHLRLTCSLHIDTLPVTPFASVATACAVDDGAGGATFFAGAQVVRVPEFAKRIDVVVIATTGSNINCRARLPNPATWTQVTADVTWPDPSKSDAVVDLELGGVTLHCEGTLPIPPQVSTKMGVVSTYNADDAGADAGAWKYVIDNVALDVE